MSTNPNPNQFADIWDRYQAEKKIADLIEDVETSRWPLELEEVLLTFLLRAITDCDWQLVRELEQHGVRLPIDDDHPELIHDIVSSGAKTEAIEYVIRLGVDLEARDMNHRTALHVACNENRLEAVQVLVNAGADINALTISDGEWTPLMEACTAGSIQIVEFLLEHGADPMIVNSYEGGTARDIADRLHQRAIVAVLDRWSTHPHGKRKRSRPI